MGEEQRSRRLFLGLAAAATLGVAAGAADVKFLGNPERDARVLIVEEQPGDSPTARWKAAISRAVADGPGCYSRILGTAAEYRITETLEISGLQDITISGQGARKTVFSSAKLDGPLEAVFSNTTSAAGTRAVRSLSFEDFSVAGGMRELTDAQATERLRDSRPWPADDAGVLKAAVKLIGNRGLTSGREVKDVSIRGVHVYGTKELPIVVFNTDGRVEVSHCRFERCKDVGFTFNENVYFCDNVIVYSADNGVSVSRGNEGGLCLRNRIYNSFYSGILVGGNIGTAERGPNHVRVAHNVVSNAGAYGIDLTLAPRNITVTHNQIEGAHLGIAVCGWVFDKAATYSRGTNRFTWTDDYTAKNIAITENRIIDSTRGGIAIYHAQEIRVQSNVISFSDHTGRLREDAVAGQTLYGVSNQGRSDSDRSTSSAVTILANEISEERRDRGITDGVYFEGSPGWSVRSNVISGAVRATEPRAG
ncbi:right-handed parallel beta-helix repeat-containing protein [Rathayibacter sp. VKM Ac-2929]|uniref:right-handed parallel beta-helix repeat-containing protein n=1 Tax=Rathayibacter sp. VKM Ac-2929 TaxID=2929480 RepID=UPI001FB39D9E|nr:right-handed parallel beta-helix repeat-containing protein [Rathayibacter sp. VKM Ac-2929]MCJ1672915.1 right-handed parallel beta-helix repeat-containing protein [Rathayibacter sp. VKM Ac-2929]